MRMSSWHTDHCTTLKRYVNIFSSIDQYKHNTSINCCDCLGLLLFAGNFKKFCRVIWYIINFKIVYSKFLIDLHRPLLNY